MLPSVRKVTIGTLSSGVPTTCTVATRSGASAKASRRSTRRKRCHCASAVTRSSRDHEAACWPTPRLSSSCAAAMRARSAAVSEGGAVIAPQADKKTRTSSGRGRRIASDHSPRRCSVWRGAGGSMHLAALALNIPGCNGLGAAGLPIANGAALAARLPRTDRVVIAFFGDGASSQGVVHESLNLAAVWKLPIIFMCENNQYALSTSSKRTIAGESIAARAAAYAIPGVRVDGNDVLAVYEAVNTAVARARAGEGPTLVEALTYRWGGHSMRANLPDYRTKEEEREWMERDPIARLRAELERRGATVMKLKELEESVELELDRAVAFATASAEPTIEVMESSVYAPHATATEP